MAYLCCCRSTADERWQCTQIVVLVSKYAIDCIVHIVTYKRQSVDQARKVKVLLAATVGLCPLVLISLPSVHICLAFAYMLVKVGSIEILMGKDAVHLAWISTMT
jgi:hypothetical protein